MQPKKTTTKGQPHQKRGTRGTAFRLLPLITLAAVCFVGCDQSQDSVATGGGGGTLSDGERAAAISGADRSIEEFNQGKEKAKWDACGHMGDGWQKCLDAFDNAEVRR